MAEDTQTGDRAPSVRAIAAGDDRDVAHVIRTVMTEFGATGCGFAIEDPEVDAMFAAYSGSRAAFFVVELDGRVVGGAGVAPLAGGDEDTCELRKMYLLPEARRRGLGDRLLGRCLDAARELGFRRCYLETLDSMHAARGLYEKHGFRPTGAAWGDTGHHGCDSWYAREL